MLAKYEHLLGQEGAPRIEIFTVDETPINAEAAATTTMVLPSESGKHGTRIVENGDGKERVTLTVCVSQERLLPPQIIFKGVPGHGITAELKEISGQVPGVLLCVQENAYQDSDLYAMCVEKWASMMGRGAIFTHDNAGVHLAQETGDALRKRGVIELRGCANATLYWQAADLGINAWIQNEFKRLLTNEPPSTVRMPRLRIVQLILEAYYALPQPMVARCIDNMKEAHKKILELQVVENGVVSDSDENLEVDMEAEITAGIVLTQRKASERKAATKIVRDEQRKEKAEERKGEKAKNAVAAQKPPPPEPKTTKQNPPPPEKPVEAAEAHKKAPVTAAKRPSPASIAIGMTVWYMDGAWKVATVSKVGSHWITVQPGCGGRLVCVKKESLQVEQPEDLFA